MELLRLSEVLAQCFSNEKTAECREIPHQLTDLTVKFRYASYILCIVNMDNDGLLAKYIYYIRASYLYELQFVYLNDVQYGEFLVSDK